jgi:predicted GTPase
MTIERRRCLILGAAGRDFHVFNIRFRDDAKVEVVAFTAQQIPNISGRRYPPELAGPLYPEGIPILPEDDLEELIRDHEVSSCVLAYSDLSHEEVMHLASRAITAGADFIVPAVGPDQLRSRLPVVAVCASRTGAGKSQTSRAIVRLLRDAGERVAVIRHPMPYGDLLSQRLQRFADEDDLARQNVTIEEREEYEPHIAEGSVVFAGVDYEEILRAAEEEADVILWDGGNNDTSFLAADLYITVVDPHRAGHELRYHPGEANLRLADLVLINKVDTADPEDTRTVRENIRRVNPDATVIEAGSPIVVEHPDRIRGRRVLCVEDGPTVTHGGMGFGAALLGALETEVAGIVDPRPYARGQLEETMKAWPHLDRVLPAMGYGAEQVRNLEDTIARAVRDGGVEAVVIGTPVALEKLVRISVPATRVRYELDLQGSRVLEEKLRSLKHEPPGPKNFRSRGL